MPRVTEEYVATEFIRPLDELKLPISLDGSGFQLDRKQRGCLIEATNDIEAIEYWLDQCTKRASTRRKYRLCAEKCLIWAVAQRGKPFSALNQSDAAAYVDFLVDPNPKEIWLGNGGALRKKPNWSPFKKPLAAKSRDYSLTVLALLFKYWHAFAYVQANPWTHLPFAFTGAARLEQAPLTAVQRDTNFVTLPEWRFILEASKQSRSPTETEAMQTILFLSYYAALKPHEIAELQLEDVRCEQLDPTDGKVWSLNVKSRHLTRQRVFLFPVVAERLARYFPTSIDGLELLRIRDGQMPLIDLIGSPFSGAGRGVHQDDDARQYLYVPTKEVFKAAADLARRGGSEIESTRLARASISWLACSLEVHVRQMELSEYALWHVLGAQRLIAPSMRRYLPADREHLDRPLRESMEALRPLVP